MNDIIHDEKAKDGEVSPLNTLVNGTPAWKDVEQELPDSYEDGNRNYVWVYTPEKLQHEVYRQPKSDVHKGYYEDGNWYIVNNGDYVDGGHGRDYEVDNVTHWKKIITPNDKT